jgi:hypothetical protein
MDQAVPLLQDMLHATARRIPGKEAITFRGRPLTYAAFEQASSRMLALGVNLSPQSAIVDARGNVLAYARTPSAVSCVRCLHRERGVGPVSQQRVDEPADQSVHDAAEEARRNTERGADHRRNRRRDQTEDQGVPRAVEQAREDVGVAQHDLGRDGRPVHDLVHGAAGLS